MLPGELSVAYGLFELFSRVLHHIFAENMRNNIESVSLYGLETTVSQHWVHTSDPNLSPATYSCRQKSAYSNDPASAET